MKIPAPPKSAGVQATAIELPSALAEVTLEPLPQPADPKLQRRETTPSNGARPASRRPSSHEPSLSTLHSASRHSSRRSSVAGTATTSLPAARRPASLASAATLALEDPYAAHARALALVRSLQSPPPSVHRDLEQHGGDPQPDRGELDEAGDAARHEVPRATVVDWTGPETRARERRRRERGQKGWRGLLRRAAGTRCGRRMADGAPEEDLVEDRGSVRRYRVEERAWRREGAEEEAEGEVGRLGSGKGRLRGGGWRLGWGSKVERRLVG